MKEDKDWDNKLRGWLKVGFRDDYNYIWESFILRDREKQKAKMLKILQRWRDDGGYLEEALKKRLEGL